MGCADGVVVQDSISASFTPYLGQWLNLHPEHRHSYIGLLKFGVFPQGLNGYKGLFTSVFNLANQQGILDGVPVRVCVCVCVCVYVCVCVCLMCARAIEIRYGTHTQRQHAPWPSSSCSTTRTLKVSLILPMYMCCM
jgi:hypothetical protein